MVDRDMNRNPDKGKRRKIHSLDYRVPRDRQVVTFKVSRPGSVSVITDTLYPIKCPYCDRIFNGATEWTSTKMFGEHCDGQHGNMPNQYEIPSWFRKMITNEEADIIKIQRENDD